MPCLSPEDLVCSIEVRVLIGSQVRPVEGM